MATLILGTVGRAVGGPVGGLIGTFVGSALDRAALGGGRAVGRLANLAVQSSAYGEPIPRIYGTMRVAGNLVWTAGIAEHSAAGGGGKGGIATTSYSYTASFAVLLSARRVGAIGRVWADGKLLRDAAGSWLTPVTMRLHVGDEGQAVDPLIAAAEAAGRAPAYRGIAYAVFEDLPLADYGNRIPNLTFELVADSDGTDAAVVIADLAATASLPGVRSGGAFPAFGGFAAAQSGSLRAQIDTLADLYGLRFADDGAMLGVSAEMPVATPLVSADLASHDGSGDPGSAPQHRAAAQQISDAVAIGFHDPARDYQPGLQRAARRANPARVAQIDIVAALDASVAKQLAGDVLARRSAARVSATFQLPFRALPVRAGGAVVRDGEARPWAVRRWIFSNFVCELAVERQPGGGAALPLADAGRVHDGGDTAPGTTMLHVLDLPGLFGEIASVPRLWVAAAGAAPGWRRAGIALSLDGGTGYAPAGVAGAPAVFGVTLSPLPLRADGGWDRTTTVDVELLADAMWLETQGPDAIYAGANLALFGNEVVQFGTAAALGSRRFRLSDLLRGRRATTSTEHAAGERFVLLDPARLLPVDLPLDAVGRVASVRATGADDLAAAPVTLTVAGNSLAPPAPVFLQMARDGGDAVFTWVRRSRAGFAWLDGVDAPLAEDREAYAVVLSAGRAAVRTVTVSSAGWRYTAADRAADGLAAGAAVTLAVRQLGDVAGASAAAAFILP